MSKAFSVTESSRVAACRHGVGTKPSCGYDFLPFFERTVQRSGISLDEMHYFADVLRRWINARDPEDPTRKRQFIVRRDPRDISVVYFMIRKRGNTSASPTATPRARRSASGSFSRSGGHCGNRAGARWMTRRRTHPQPPAGPLDYLYARA